MESPRMPLISVIVPAFNASRFLAETLRSACRQTHRDLEIIVVDDGSTDNTSSIAGDFARSDERIRLLKIANSGVSTARNFGIAAARSDLIATLDADDLWHPQKLERQLRIMQSAPLDVGVVYCWSSGIDESGDVVLPVWNASLAEGDVLEDIVRSGILSNGSTPLMRWAFIEKAGGYDEHLRLCEDWQFYTAMAGVCRFRVIPECLTGYRLTDKSLSMNAIEMERAIQEVTDWISRSWPDLPESVLQDRAGTVDRYLAFLAIRAGKPRLAARYLARATFGRDGVRLSRQTCDLIALMIARAVGIRQYRWDFWTRPQPFLPA
jgi:glycosyltransferase involved in cell wall biosynthesis